MAHVGAVLAFLSRDSSFPWDAIQAIGVIAGGIFALYQLFDLKSDQKKRATLDACNRYDFDPVLNNALEKLKEARDSGDLKSKPSVIRYYACTVLNYLDAIAIGAEQGFYDKSVIRAHLEPIIRFHVDELLSSEAVAKMGGDFDPRYWKAVLDLLYEWNVNPK